MKSHETFSRVHHGLKYKRQLPHFGAMLLWWLLHGTCLQAQSHEKSPHWQATLHFDPVQKRLEGPVRLLLPPEAQGQKQAVVFFPAQLALGEKTDELTSTWTYPRGYQPAHLTLEPLSGQPSPACFPLPAAVEGLLQQCQWPTHQAPLEKTNTHGELHAPRETLASSTPEKTPSLPQTTPSEHGVLSWHALLQLQLPERFGPFGSYGGTVTLAGGWLPSLLPPGSETLPPSQPPAPVTVDLQLVLPSSWSAWLEGQPLMPCAQPPSEPLPPEQVCVEGQAQARFPVLQVIPNRTTLEQVSLSPHVRLIEPRMRVGERVRLEKLVISLERFWQKQGLGEVPPTVLSRAPLRRSLTLPGEGVLLLSDRALRTAPGIRRFHALALAQALLEHWVMRRLSAELSPWEQAPVASLWADVLLSRYRQTLPAGAWTARALLSPLRIFPPVDGLLNAPKFPFSQELYEWPYRWDALQESVVSLLNPGQGGAAVRHQLELQQGAQALTQALEQAQQRATFDVLSVLAEQQGVARSGLEQLLQGLRQPPAQVDFRVAAVRSRRVPGGHQTTITLETKGALGEPPPPVPLKLVVGRVVQRHTWQAKAQETLTLETPQAIRKVELDPDAQRLEINAAGTRLRDNNVWPPPARLLFQAALTSFELESLRPTGSAVVLLTRPNQRDWLVMGEVYSSQQVLLGGTLGGFRFLGPYRDAQWRSHRLGLQLNRAQRQGLAWLGESADAYLNTTGLRLSYRYDDRLLLQDSGRGGAWYAGLEGGWAETTETTGPYGILSLQGVKPLALSRVGNSGGPLLVLRAQVELGLGLPSGAGGPGEGLFVLGGPSLVRGLENSARYGNQRWVSSAELRLPAAQELDLNLGLARLRRVQLVPFVDVGAIGYEPEALLSPALGMGLGTRLYLDMLGLYEGLAGLDLAWEPAALVAGEVDARTPQLLIRFAQPF